MKFKVACIQLCSSDNVDENLSKILNFSKQAIEDNAEFITTPENSSLFSLDKQELLSKAESFENNNFIKAICDFVKKNKIWFLIGGMPVKDKNNKLFNRSILIDQSGKVVNYYDKIHMFDVKLPNGEIYEESKKFQAGNSLKVHNLPWGKIGLTICYDLRFPLMYRKLTKDGAIFISVPSAFTKNTGERHWHTLLKARAIENMCYIFAPAQTGIHPNQRETYGHSLIISPDGEVLAEKKDGEGILLADVDTELVTRLRAQIPSLDQD